MTAPLKIAIIGTVGIPGMYGGFETLAENMVRFDYAHGASRDLTVYCSARSYSRKPDKFLHARLRYLPIEANGITSVIYDMLSLGLAAWHGSHRILLLGISGATFLPVFRVFSRAYVITNLDGIEWKRQKWKGIARWFLKISERFAIRYSHTVIADNNAIADYVRETYGVSCRVVAYGGDHALLGGMGDISELRLPDRYALAICRIEPENNIEMILEAFSRMLSEQLVVVGNWPNSRYGEDLRKRFGDLPNIHLLDPVYVSERLLAIRERAWLYVHGHSAGGTNPSLVEMMHFGIPVAAFDCSFNRFTTENRARYYADVETLVSIVQAVSKNVDDFADGDAMREIARRRYTWEIIGKSYFDILE